MIEQALLEILRCPIGKVKLKEENNFLVCTRCGLKFPIKDGIPVILLDEAVLPEGVKHISEIKCAKKQ
ncbi:MAG: Trm112 family protein [Ignavibacteriae bacterium]|nr:MAG: Trm112 family protein [Ignavibacteriota bacterium]